MKNLKKEETDEEEEWGVGHERIIDGEESESCCDVVCGFDCERYIASKNDCC